MIAKTNALNLLTNNLQRTEMLIVAMGKIKIYNGIYQANLSNLEDYKIVKMVQDKELAAIEQTCAEHTIISLVTTFETYYKELLQQILAVYPEYFTSKNTAYTNKINELLQNPELLNYEDIEQELGLINRKHYYRLLETYSIPFFSEDEKQQIEYLYVKRNNYVHSAGRPDRKLKARLADTKSPVKESVLSTEVKRIRTWFGKLLHKSYDRVISTVNVQKM